MTIDNKWVAGKGTTALGIIGTALGGLATIMNGGAAVVNAGAATATCSENMPVSRYELGLQQRIAEQGAEIGLLKADKYTDQKIVDVYNAINTATISCLGNQVNGLQAVLNGLTKVVIPSDNVCPEPMPAKNSWTAPTTAASTTAG